MIKSTLLLVFLVGIGELSAQKQLSAEEAVKLALENNYGIKISKNQIAVSENNADILNSGYLPSLTGNAGVGANLDNTEATFADGSITTLTGAESSRYNASLDLNYTLFDGFGRKYDYKSLQEQKELTMLEAQETIENTIIQLFSIYYNVAQLEENLEVLNQTLGITKDRLVRAEYRYEYGQGSNLDVLNATVDINNDSINLISALQQLDNAKRDLNVVLGNTLTEDFKVDTAINFSSQLDREPLIEKAKIKNVAILQNKKDIEISELSLKSNQSAYLPTVGLTGAYGWNRNNNNQASFVSVVNNVGLSGGLTLSWNLFDGGSTMTNVSNAKINLETQQLQKESILLSLERDFNNAWYDYQNKLSIYFIQEKNIVSAQNNFTRTEEKFKQGLATSIEFRQAQLNLLNAEISMNRAKYEAKYTELQVLQLSGELLSVPF